MNQYARTYHEYATLQCIPESWYYAAVKRLGEMHHQWARKYNCMMTGGGASLALARLAMMRDLASSDYGAERLAGLDLKLFLEDFEFAPPGHCLRLYRNEYEAALSIGWEDDQDGMTLHEVESSGGREAVVFGQRFGVPGVSAFRMQRLDNGLWLRQALRGFSPCPESALGMLYCDFLPAEATMPNWLAPPSENNSVTANEVA